MEVPDAPEPGSSRTSSQRAFRRFIFVTSAPVAGILFALVVGVSPERLRAAVAFQAVAVAAAVYLVAALKMQRRRARRQRRIDALVGTRFTTPIWMTLMECSIPIEIGASVAAVVATFGFAGVGTGVFVTFALIGLCMPLFKIGLQPRWIVFEPDGIRLAVARTTFLIPWTTIERIEAVGPDHFVALNLVLNDSDAILQTVRPNDTKSRDRTRTVIQSPSGSGARVLLMPWAAGLDGRTLERGIRDGMSGKTPGMN